MSDTSGIVPFVFPLKGGLVLNKSTFSIDPGVALELENFEPDNGGGYRRINGYKRWSGKVPHTVDEEIEPILMSAFFKGEILAARGDSVYKSKGSETELKTSLAEYGTTMYVLSTEGFPNSGTLELTKDGVTERIGYTSKGTDVFRNLVRGVDGTTPNYYYWSTPVSETWSRIESSRTNANKYSFERGSLAGQEKIIYCDGSNPASIYDGVTVKQITGQNAPDDPQYISIFKNAAFYAGMSVNPQEIVYTSPVSFDDFDVAKGAGSFVVDEAITGMIVFRESLFIFSANRIYKLEGSSAADYRLEPVTREIGCRNGWTIREFAGDVVFLGPDGLRTIAGTEKIGDVELGSISKQIQQLFQDKTDVVYFDSLVIPNKTQYRIFFSKEGTTRKATTGVICTRKEESYEFSTTLGIKPSCCDSDVYKGKYYIMFGGFDGIVYQMEDGITFDGEPIIGRYRSPDITAGDPGLRKAFQRVIINYAPEGELQTDLFLRYDYESADTPRPAAYPFDSTKVVALYGSSIYGIATYGGQTDPLIRQSVEGSGFSVALRVIDSGIGTPYSLKGFQLEFTPAARR